MHDAWLIEDIRYLIFEHLERQDLSRLARTCNIFFEIATDELWRSMTSFSPFMDSLPKDLRRKPLRAEDIQRLDYYAAKVQNLCIESDRTDKVIRLPPQFWPENKRTKKQPCKSWRELWREVAELRPASEFFPNLRRLRINNAMEDILVPLIGISGSNLIHIYIKYVHHRTPESTIRRFLDALPDTSRLEYLFVRGGEPDLVPSKLIQQSPLKHLRLDPRIHARKHQEEQFKRFPLRREIFEKSTLEHLTLGLTREWYSPGIEAPKSKYLPALKTLWLNLATFRPDDCDGCLNVTAHSWTCRRPRYSRVSDDRHPTDCGRRAPTLFFEGMGNPELELLNIKFPGGANGSMFLDIVSAANNNCHLSNLTELALAGGGSFNNCGECRKGGPPTIQPKELRAAMKMLLPMPRLKVLRLSVAPNFLDILDLELYRTMTDGLQSLEKLWLGHREFQGSSEFEGTTFYERVPMHHLAAFCSMLPNLVEVSVGAVDCFALEESPHLEWACPGVTSLRTGWAGRDTERTGTVSRDQLHLSLRTYFPNSDLAQEGVHPRLYIFC